MTTKKKQRKEKEVTEEELKNLFISLGKDDDIQNIIEEYINESGLSDSDFHFATGFVQHAFGNDNKAVEQFLYLLQTYFYAGVYYGKTSKKASFKYMTLKEREKKAQEIKTRLDKTANIDKSYMG